MAHDGTEYKRHRSPDWLNGNGPYLSFLRGDLSGAKPLAAIAELFKRS